MGMDFRIPRSSDDSDEGLLSDVSQPLWPLWANFGESDRADAIEGFFAQLSEGQRNILAVAICRSEISNGGVDQFFLQSTGNIWRQALSGLRAIEADRYTKLLEKVLALFPGANAPIEAAKRNEILESLPESRVERLFESVNEKWDELDSSEKHSLAAHCARYIRANLTFFFVE
jgi:hypothetical protein